MIKDREPISELEKGALMRDHVRQEQRDLIVLKYMAQKMRLTLHTLETEDQALPLCYLLDERHAHKHRLMIFQPKVLLEPRTISFVGFVSGQHKQIDATIQDELQIADGKMANELTRIAGFLGYASLELRKGRWYNLVLLDNYDVKAHLLGSEIHKHAANYLAPRYYEWIRLHSGIIEGGVNKGDFILHRTKLYNFPGGLYGIEHKSNYQGLSH